MRFASVVRELRCTFAVAKTICQLQSPNRPFILSRDKNCVTFYPNQIDYTNPLGHHVQIFAIQNLISRSIEFMILEPLDSTSATQISTLNISATDLDFVAGIRRTTN